MKAFREYASLSSSSRSLAAYYLLYGVSSGLSGFIAIFYVISLGYSEVFYGALSSAGGFSYVAFLMLSPYVSRRIGARKALAVGTGLYSASSAALAASASPATLFAAFVASGASGALIYPNFSSLVSVSEERNRLTSSYSLSGFSNQIGAFAGTALSGYLADSLKALIGQPGSYRAVIAIASAVAAASLVEPLKRGPDIRPGPLRRRSGLRMMWRPLVAAALIGAGAGFLIPYFQLQFKYRFNAPVQQISLVFSAANLAIAIIMLFMPAVERALGSLNSIVWSWIAATLFMIAMPFVSGLPAGFYLFSSFYIIRTVIMNAIGPVQSSFEMSLFQEQERPFFSSAENFIWNATNSATVVAGGIIMQESLNMPFFICGAFYLSASAVYYTLMRRYAVQR